MPATRSHAARLHAIQCWFKNEIACHWSALPEDDEDGIAGVCIECDSSDPSADDIVLRDIVTEFGDNFTKRTYGDKSRPFWLPKIDHAAKCNGRCQRAKIAARDSQGNISFLTGNTMPPFHRPDCQIWKVLSVLDYAKADVVCM